MSQTGNVYGQALYSLVKEENLSESVLQELTALEESFRKEPQFLRLLSASNVAVEERCQVLDECFRDKVHLYTLNFMKILTEKGMIRTFPQCVRAFCEQYNQDHNIMTVVAVTAEPLSQDQLSRLTEKLSKISGKTAQIQNRIDPACLGGVRLDYDGKRIDGSIATRLDAVRDMLKNTVL